MRTELSIIPIGGIMNPAIINRAEMKYAIILTTLKKTFFSFIYVFKIK